MDKGGRCAPGSRETGFGIRDSGFGENGKALRHRGSFLVVLLGLGARDLLLYVPLHLAAAAVDVDGEEAVLTAGGLWFGGVHEGPDDFAVGFGHGQVFKLVEVEPIKPAFAHIARRDFDGANDAVDEHEPVAFAFELLFADEADKAEAREGQVEAGFFVDFALGALHGAFAQRDVELAADRADEVEVWLLFAVQKQDAVVSVAKIAEAGDAVGLLRQGTSESIGGHGGEGKAGGVENGERRTGNGSGAYFDLLRILEVVENVAFGLATACTMLR